MAGQLIPGMQKLGSYSSIAASAEVSCGILNCNNIRTATLSCRGTYNASATTAATVNLYYSPDGEFYDTVPFTSFLVNLASGVVQESAIIDLPEAGFIQVKISNGDATYAFTSVELKSTVARYGDTYVEGDKVVRLLTEISKELAEMRRIIPIEYNIQA